MLAAATAVVLLVGAALAQLRPLGPQDVNLLRLQAIADSKAAPSGSRAQQPFGLASPHAGVPEDYEIDPSTKIPEFKAQWFTQPLDHFSKENAHTWRQRFWVNTRHYKPGSDAPVIVIDAGETSGVNRLPFLDTGIANILAEATGGIGVVLEHRYYGASVPVQNLSTDSLRWLDNAQSAADSANFMRNVEFDGVDEDITAPGSPWIYYGGSYAGARAAHMKVLYPDIIFGSIASSAVTHATLVLWEYTDLIRTSMNQTCAVSLQAAIEHIDTILTHPKPVGPLLRKTLKHLFGLSGLEHDQDFAALLQYPLSGWQAKNWNPEVGSTSFDEFCAQLTKPHPWLAPGHEMLEFGHSERQVLSSAGLVPKPGDAKVDFVIWNYAQWIKKRLVSRCPADMTVEECFGTYDVEKYRDDSLPQTWRKWLFQVCTEWGYFFTAPPDPEHPRIVSKLRTLDYESKICQQAYPDGQYFRVPLLPNVTAVNMLGDFAIAADKLALIDGEVDPWRPACPHSRYADDREDTIAQPFKLIPGGVHHYDENGLANPKDEPAQIQQIHMEQVHFVKEWLKDWTATHLRE